jgi:UDP-3-O-[3-hydroxymyristoyl] glucosamine N-acyltransferase
MPYFWVMEFSAQQIAALVSGEIVGDPNVAIGGVSKIEEGTPGTLSFLSNPKYEAFIYQTQSSICIVNDTFTPTKALPSTLTLIKVPDAYACFAKLLEAYSQAKQKAPGIHPQAFIHPSATVEENVYVGAFVSIGEGVFIGKGANIHPHCSVGDHASIGEGTTLFAGVHVYDSMVIGKRCILHSGVVIGSDGFGFAPDAQGVYHKIPQIGNVVIEDDVEIGANTTIDRATMGSTVLKKGVKIDNLCQIAHNVVIDEHTAIAAQAGIAGSAKLGKHLMVGGQVGISGHLHIADGTKIVAQSGIPSTVHEPETLMGSPAMPFNDFKKAHIVFRKLPELRKEIQRLNQEIEALKSKTT